jgi:hypothetical protein
MYRCPGTRLAALLVAAAAIGPGCGSRAHKDDVPVAVGPAGPAGPPPEGEVAGGLSGRPVLVGEMCPTAASGRPAIRPLFVRRERWRDEAAALISPVERREARQFSVLGWDGRRAGLFSVAGSAETDHGAAAIGAYAGHSPCEKRRGAGPGVQEPDCEAVVRGCGLAAAVLEPAGGFQSRPAEEDPDPAAFETGGACIAGGNLVVDIDRDGKPEAYPVAGFASATGAGSEAVVSVAGGGAACTPRFAFRGASAPGAGGMDVLGVVDLDGDGRQEIVVSLRAGGRQVWALYSARESSARLERVAVATPWPSGSLP